MGRRAQFDQADLVRAGLRVVRRRGWSAVSISSVASELSVTPMALYRVAQDADDLKRLIADAAAENLQPTPADGPLIDALYDWALHAYDELSSLKGVAAFVLHQWTELPRWLAIVDTFLGLAERDGLTGTEAVHTVNAVFAYVLARAQLLQTVSKRRSLQPLRTYADRYPHIRAELDDFRIARTDEAFMFGLHALCAGLRQQATGRAT